jgi:hypothetical protein
MRFRARAHVAHVSSCVLSSRCYLSDIDPSFSSQVFRFIREHMIRAKMHSGDAKALKPTVCLFLPQLVRQLGEHCPFLRAG